MFRLVLFSSLVLCFWVQPVQAGLLEFLFPTLRERGPQPHQTLQAPFAESVEGGETKEEGVQGAPENSIPLEFPHRSSNAIALWIVKAVSESLMFDKEIYEDSLKDTDVYFSVSGKQQYLQSIQDLNIAKVAKSKRYAVRSFVSKDPLLLNEGNVDGRYRWLYDVPITMSTMERGLESYGDSRPVTRDIRVRVQVGRSAENKNPDGVLIETWEGKVIQAEKDK